jgi:hypothetical protein
LLREFISHKTQPKVQGETASFNGGAGARNAAPHARQDTLDALAIDMLEMSLSPVDRQLALPWNRG